MIDAGRVLGATLATEFAPASNLKGKVAGAAWRYLLPSMERRRVVLVGRPSTATIAAVGAVADDVVVLGPTTGHDRAAGSGGARTVPGAEVQQWLTARPAGSVDLVWIGPDGAGIAASVEAALDRLLDVDGVVVRERLGPSLAGQGTPRGSGRVVATVDVRPDRGEIRSAVGRGDEASARLLEERGLAGPPIRLPGPRRLSTLAGRFVGGRPRSLEIAIPAARATLAAPPTYLAEIAAEAGIDIADHHCALSAVGEYNTQKVLFVLRPPEAAEPTMVVKLTRDPSVNRRLETERDALRRLEEVGPLTGGRVPRVLFAGRHAGLAVVGESAVSGVPFGDRTRAGTDHGPASDALAWFTGLAEETARPAPAGAVADALRDLFGRYAALCHPTDAEAAGLEAAIDAVARSTSPIPLVFQHGDPGTWNLLVGTDDRVVFLDWENADAAGMPLWDLLYLLRSLAVGAARRAGVRRRLTAVDRFLFDDSPLSGTIVDAVAVYTARLGISSDLVEPLFHLCWMHQALKEATRTDPARVRNAHFNRLLRLGFERRTAPTLRRLFAPGDR